MTDRAPAVHIVSAPSPFPGLTRTYFCLTHLKFLLLTEISRVRKDMYNDTLNGSTEKRSAELPDAVGPIVQLQEKLYVPVKEYPDVSIFVVLLIFSCITQYAIKITFIFISCFKSAIMKLEMGVILCG